MSIRHALAKTARCWVGIDPGLDGCIAFLVSNPSGRRDECHFQELPTLQSGPKGRREYDLPRLATILQAVAKKADFVVIEKAIPAIGKSGAASSYRIGHGYGALCMGLTMPRRSPWIEKRPNDWKREVGLTLPRGSTPKQRKAAAIALCSRLYPDAQLVPPGCRVPRSDRAEALLLARLAKQIAQGKKAK